MQIEEDGQIYEIYIESKETPQIQPPASAGGERASMGVNPMARLQQAQ